MSCRRWVWTVPFRAPVPVWSLTPEIPCTGGGFDSHRIFRRHRCKFYSIIQYELTCFFFTNQSGAHHVRVRVYLCTCESLKSKWHPFLRDGSENSTFVVRVIILRTLPWTSYVWHLLNSLSVLVVDESIYINVWTNFWWSEFVSSWKSTWRSWDLCLFKWKSIILIAPNYRLSLLLGPFCFFQSSLIQFPHTKDVWSFRWCMDCICIIQFINTAWLSNHHRFSDNSEKSGESFKHSVTSVVPCLKKLRALFTTIIILFNWTEIRESTDVVDVKWFLNKTMITFNQHDFDQILLLPPRMSNWSMTKHVLFRSSLYIFLFDIVQKMMTVSRKGWWARILMRMNVYVYDNRYQMNTVTNRLTHILYHHTLCILSSKNVFVLIVPKRLRTWF